MCQSTRHGPGSLLFDTRSFFLCDADLSEVSRRHVRKTSVFFLVTIFPEEGRYGFESDNKEGQLV